MLRRTKFCPFFVWQSSGKSVTIEIMDVKLSEKQRAIIVGSILGDGYIGVSPAHTSYLEVKQQESRREYVFWLYKELKNLCGSQPKRRSDNKQWRLYTKYSKVLYKHFRQTFYLNGRKVIPGNIDRILVSSLSLAVWYMDDGRLDYRPKSHYAYYLATDSFTKREVNLLIKVLKKNFGIEASMHYLLSRKTRYPKIYIGKAGRDKFAKLIEPYTLDCFSDKNFYCNVTPQRLLRKEK